jgi:serine/threonine protein kinase
MGADEFSTWSGSPNHHGMRGTLRWMAPELMYPDKFGFTHESREQLPSKRTDIYTLGMTIFEVSSFPRLYFEVFYSCSGRSSRDALLSTVHRQPQLLCTASSKESDQTDHFQGSQINCGSCWRPLGLQNMRPHPPDVRPLLR